MRPIRTLRSMLVKKRPENPRVFGAIYNIECADCSWNYIGETGRTICERKKEHFRAVKNLDVLRSEVARHAIEDDHNVKIKEMKMIDREQSWRKRIIKEALWTQKLKGTNKVMYDVGSSWNF